MKKTLTYLIIALVIITSVSATDMKLTPDDLTLKPGETSEVFMCITQDDQPLDVEVVVTTCRDENDKPGCQAGEEDDGQLIVTHDYNTGDDGCADLSLSLSPDANGKHYYTVNGVVGGSVISRESGYAYSDVPEFGIIAAIGLLLGSGVFIQKKRKE